MAHVQPLSPPPPNVNSFTLNAEITSLRDEINHKKPSFLEIGDDPEADARIRVIVGGDTLQWSTSISPIGYSFLDLGRGSKSFDTRLCDLYFINHRFYRAPLFYTVRSSLFVLGILEILYDTGFLCTIVPSLLSVVMPIACFILVYHWIPDSVPLKLTRSPRYSFHPSFYFRTTLIGTTSLVSLFTS